MKQEVLGRTFNWEIMSCKNRREKQKQRTGVKSKREVRKEAKMKTHLNEENKS
jgi:hypothetical protein